MERALVRPTTYREYILRQLERGDYPLSEAVRSKMEECASAVEARLRPGDELWEWQAQAQSRLHGVSGLAIMRGGEIIDSWVERK